MNPLYRRYLCITIDTVLSYFFFSSLMHLSVIRPCQLREREKNILDIMFDDSSMVGQKELGCVQRNSKDRFTETNTQNQKFSIQPSIFFFLSSPFFIDYIVDRPHETQHRYTVCTGISSKSGCILKIHFVFNRNESENGMILYVGKPTLCSLFYLIPK